MQSWATPCNKGIVFIPAECRPQTNIALDDLYKQGTPKDQLAIRFRRVGGPYGSKVKTYWAPDRVSCQIMGKRW